MSEMGSGRLPDRLRPHEAGLSRVVVGDLAAQLERGWTYSSPASLILHDEHPSKSFLG